MILRYKDSGYTVLDSLFTSGEEYRLVVKQRRNKNKESCWGCDFHRNGCTFNKHVVRHMSCFSVTGGIYKTLRNIQKENRKEKIKKIFLK